MIEAAEWVRAQLEILQSGPELMRHIALDTLLGVEQFVSPWDLMRAKETYRHSVIATGEDSADYMAALIVPLSPSDALEPPQDAEPAAWDLNEVHPPSLYLFDRRFFGGFNDFEEYRVPIETAEIDVPDGTVRAYYTCYRYPDARINDWEYSRAIWFQHFPDA